MRAIDAVLAQPWAIQPDWLSMIAAVAQRQFDAPVVAAMRDNESRRSGSGLRVEDGIALLGITGPIFPRANMLTEMSGATSLDQLRAQFREALADSGVRAIVLEIDSPGGAVSGVADFAAEIMAARGVKPIVAYGAGTVASAAYWLGSAASRMVIDKTAVVGSIGVVTAVSKQVQPDQNGEVTVEIVSTNAPDKRPDPTDSAGRAAIVATLDALEREFIASVAAHRKVSPAAVIEKFGQGGVKVGADAVASGMADAVGSLRSVLTGLAAAGPVVPSTIRAAAAAVSENGSMTVTLASLRTDHPELVAQIEASARAEGETAGRAAERDRIAGVESAALPGHENLVAKFKADGKTTPGEAALAINAAEREKLKGVRAGLQADGEKGPAPAPAGQPAAAKPDSAALIADTSRPVEDRCKAAWEIDEKIRAEFGTVGKFTAYQRAVEAGQVKVFAPGKRA